MYLRRLHPIGKGTAGWCSSPDYYFMKQPYYVPPSYWTKNPIEGILMKVREEDLRKELETPIAESDIQGRYASRLGIRLCVFKQDLHIWD